VGCGSGAPSAARTTGGSASGGAGPSAGAAGSDGVVDAAWFPSDGAAGTSHARAPTSVGGTRATPGSASSRRSGPRFPARRPKSCRRRKDESPIAVTRAREFDNQWIFSRPTRTNVQESAPVRPGTPSGPDRNCASRRPRPVHTAREPPRRQRRGGARGTRVTWPGARNPTDPRHELHRCASPRRWLPSEIRRLRGVARTFPRSDRARQQYYSTVRRRAPGEL
jgi:hypothetical protein